MGAKRRRRWTDADKLKIIAAVDGNEWALSRVARRYDVSRSQIYNWRHAFKKKGARAALSGPTFLPVDIASSASQAPGSEERAISPVVVELCLAQGRRLRIDSGIACATLMWLMLSVEGA